MPSHRKNTLPRRPRLRLAKYVVGIVFLSLVFATGSYVVFRGENGVPTADVDVAPATSSAVHTSLESGTNRRVRHYRHHRRHHVVSQATPSPAPSTTHSATPTPTLTPTSNQSCSGARNTPGGADPWGGCWPGPDNTGVAADIQLTTYTGPCETRSNNVTIDAKIVNCDLDILGGGQITIRNSKVNGSVLNNGSGSLLIEDTVINGGSEHSETVGGDHITILRSNLYGNQHELYCGSNCTVEDSWLHDNYNGAALGWHQNGFLSTGGSNYTIRHNSVFCVGGCTSDIAFIPNGNVSSATVDENLLLATTDVAYCLYPSSGDPAADKPGIVNQMTVTNNVFQRGPNGKCGQFGPVYGWDTPNGRPGTDGFDNVWSGNTWNDGSILNP